MKNLTELVSFETTLTHGITGEKYLYINHVNPYLFGESYFTAENFKTGLWEKFDPQKFMELFMK